MLTLSCPSCGANVSFKSKASVFAVCSFCKSTLVRHDMNLEAVGKMAELQDDMSPLQIGTTGKHNGKSFELIGRLRVSYEDGFWNEWYAIFNNGDTGWLAEAQGFYGMCFESNGVALPRSEDLRTEATVDLKKHGYFQVEDVRPVSCTYSEGELPINAMKGRESLSVDLTAPGKRMATIEYARDGVRLYVGNYQEFEQYAFKNLRSLDGW